MTSKMMSLLKVQTLLLFIVVTLLLSSMMAYGQPATGTTSNMDDSSTEGVVDTIMSTSSHRVLGGKGTSKASKAGDRCAESSSLSCGAVLNTDDALVVLEEDLDCTDFGGNGIVITATGIVLDCRGNKIIGGINTEDGIEVTGTATDVVIKDCITSGWGDDGIVLRGERTKLLRVSSTNNNVGLRIYSEASATVVDSVFNNNRNDGVWIFGASLFMADSEASSNGSDGVLAFSGANVTLVNADANKNGRFGIWDSTDGVFKLHEVQSCENNQTSAFGFDVYGFENDGNSVFNSVTCDTSDPDGLCNCTCH